MQPDFCPINFSSSTRPHPSSSPSIYGSTHFVTLIFGQDRGRQRKTLKKKKKKNGTTTFAEERRTNSRESVHLHDRSKLASHFEVKSYCNFAVYKFIPGFALLQIASRFGASKDPFFDNSLFRYVFFRYVQTSPTIFMFFTNQ